VACGVASKTGIHSTLGERGCDLRMGAGGWVALEWLLQVYQSVSGTLRGSAQCSEGFAGVPVSVRDCASCPHHVASSAQPQGCAHCRLSGSDEHTRVLSVALSELWRHPRRPAVSRARVQCSPRLQAPVAVALIEEGLRTGGWVFLANCHLMTSWLPNLEKIVEGLPTTKPSPNFRLWLSSAPCSAFPIATLQVR